MDAKNRLEEIKRVIDLNTKNNADELLKIERMWKGRLKVFPVYEMPLSLLVYNKYNGRILSRTQSLEAQKNEIDVSTKEGAKIIAKLLWESKESANKSTLADLEKYGQKEVAMITSDGVIVDGNRRAMLLNRINKYDYLKTIVLPVSSTDDPLEIERLETSFQMGSDEKLSYNPIEKYLKTKKLVNDLTSGIEIISKDDAIKKIAEWMQESKTDIKFFLDVMQTMDDYLEYLEYDNLYIQLDKKEEQFRDLTRWIETYKSGESGKAFDGYTTSDVDDLKCLSFDFIRSDYEGKEFRNIAKGQRGSHFFGNEEIWRDFVNQWTSIMNNVVLPSPDFSSSNLKAHLDSIDQQFKNQVKQEFADIVREALTSLHRKKDKDKPSKTLKHIKNDVNSLNLSSKSLSDIDKKANLDSAKSISSEFINKISNHSVSDALDVIISSLNKIDLSLENITRLDRVNQKESIEERLKSVKKILFDISKKI